MTTIVHMNCVKSMFVMEVQLELEKGVMVKMVQQRIVQVDHIVFTVNVLVLLRMIASLNIIAGNQDNVAFLIHVTLRQIVLMSKCVIIINAYTVV